MTHRSALLVWLSLLSTPALAQSPTQATLRHDGVLLGSPSVDSSPVTVVLREGTVVTILERADPPFFKVEYNGQQGYISEGYLDMRAPELVRQEMEAKRAEEEARRTAAETARREREEARERAKAEKLENEMSRLKAIMAAASLTSEQLRSACWGQKILADESLPVRCGLWGVGKNSDVITDAEKSYLSWIGGDIGTMLLVSPGPSVVFSTKDLLTITDREVTAQVRIDKGDVQTFKAHTFQSQVTILASTAAKDRGRNYFPFLDGRNV